MSLRAHLDLEAGAEWPDCNCTMGLQAVTLAGHVRLSIAHAWPPRPTGYSHPLTGMWPTVYLAGINSIGASSGAIFHPLEECDTHFSSRNGQKHS